MAHVGAVQRERVARTAQRQRRPRGQPEVRVDDVQASAGEAAAQEPRGARIRERAGWELEQLDLDAGDLPQCRNLVAHEHAASRAFARGGHVRDDQRAHRAHDSGRPSGIMAAVSTPANEPNERPIAVFDSGVGGLTVLQELLVELPQEDFLYLGDTAHFPYGERSAEDLERFALEIAELLLARRAKLLVVACNAASASALGALQERMLSTTLGVYVTGVIEPESRLAASASTNRRVGLLATSATVRSGAYTRALARHAPDAELVSVACPDLAPIIQQGFPLDRRIVETVRGYCAPLRDGGVDTVILGCTHYPLIAPMLQRMLGPGVQLITSGRSLAVSVARSLDDSQLRATRTDEGEYRFLCTGDVDAFRELGSRFLQMPIEAVEHVEFPLAKAACPAHT